MPSVFSKNCIFAGELDSYCLACTKHLLEEEDVWEHIQQLDHKRNVDICGYFEKLKEDCIRKVKLGYFCEFCNLTFPTATKVGLHVEEQSHLDRKRRGWLKRSGDTVLFLQHNVWVTENSWNGIVDNACLLCNVEFDDDHVHKQEQNHILNLIRNKVTIGSNSIFRKIDSVFQCLTCNCAIGEDVLKEHLSSKVHTDKYLEKEISNKTIKEETNTKSLTSELKSNTNDKNKNADPDEIYCKALSAENYVFNYDGRLMCMICDRIFVGDAKQHVGSQKHQDLLKIHKESIKNKECHEINAYGCDNYITSTNTKSQVLDFVSANYKKDINIDLIKDIIVCKKCSKHLIFDIEVIKSHMVEHDAKVSSKRFSLKSEEKPNTRKVDGKTLYTKPVLKSKEKPASSSQRPSLLKEIEELAKKHGLFLNKDENKVECKMCNSQVTATMKNLKEHLEGSKHKKNVPKLSNDKKCPKKNLEKVVLKDFINVLHSAENRTALFFIVNDKFLVERVHFVGGLANFHNKIICRICDIDLIQENVLIHLISPIHQEKVINSYVLTSVEGEFVRQISSDLFDCVHCGKMETDWDDMLNHLSTSEHKERKDLHDRLLIQLKVQRFLFEKELENLFHNSMFDFMNMPPF